MFIAPVNSTIQNRYQTNFRAKRDDYVTKKFLEGTEKEVKETVKPVVSDTIDAFKKLSPAAQEYFRCIKEKGITYIESFGKKVNVATGQYGFFTVNASFDVPKNNAKDYIVNILSNYTKGNKDFEAYLDCVNNLKRQDIIMNAMGVQTHELDSLISQERKDSAQHCFAKFFKNKYFNEELFYINKRAFYYDKDTKSLYSLHTDINPKCTKDHNVTVCNFITDEKGNAVGYDKKEWEIYNDRYKNFSYREQNEPSRTLPKIAPTDNNKLFAECFRFGNAVQDNKTIAGTKYALEHLKNKAKIADVTEEQLQFVKFLNKNNEEVTRICYFNPVSGRSIVYNRQGEYLYQIEYIKDDEGNIIAMSRM